MKYMKQLGFLVVFLSQMTSVNRDFEKENKAEENLALCAWLFSVNILEKQRCFQCTGTENKRTRWCPAFQKCLFANTSDLLMANILQLCPPFQEECNNTSQEMQLTSK